ncbi:MAG: PEP/pyruvate-binding domain-containing protein [Proteobacteria bacterium]|nr:PEP/pyruvate-binding domain-containing protein [Pseudomonadota bacterium]
MSDKWIYWLEELGKEDNERVGKKCANLGEIAKAGLPVPKGFCLSIDGYTMFTNKTGAAEEIGRYLEDHKPAADDIEGIRQLSLKMRQIMESKPMPTEMSDVILSYYGKLCDSACALDLAVSTRSAGAVSHPGQYETYLNVKGKEDLLDKVRKVWASTCNERSVAFRIKKDMPLGKEPIGVAVLTMVKARSAGIAFSADPNTGDTSKIIVEANWGLGESVVSGELMPDRWVLNKETLEIRERTLGKKDKATVCLECGIDDAEIAPEKACSYCLTDEELYEIGKLANKLEAHFGVPQDIEWAVDEDMPFPNIILLQTRPVVIAKQSAADQVADLMIGMLSFR